MPELTTRPLDESTWDAFAKLVEANNGVWGGCWCVGFHPKEEGPSNREKKLCRVREGRTHSSLVFEGEDCVGWCQFGSPDELPRIKHGRAYREGLTKLPDWRITCFYVGKGHRGKKVAITALRGALEQIGLLGGGFVESYPEDVTGRKISSSFLYNGTLDMFVREGFEKTRRLNSNHWVVTKVVGGR